MPECTIHLIARQAGTDPSSFLNQLKLDIDEQPYIIKGKPCGWVHRPHSLDVDQLTGHDWDIFLLTDFKELPERVRSSVAAHISVNVQIPDEQYNKLVSEIDQTPKVSSETPALPEGWSPTAQINTDPSGNIPKNAIVDVKDAELEVGELRLDEAMANLLSNAETRDIRGSPVCFFNLFKYKNNDRSTHDSYMQGFKDKFGPAAGAQIKFMGPAEGKWDDANLVQYDSVWHYAFMLSTDVYKELNKEKVSGLEDTCILLVSEIGL